MYIDLKQKAPLTSSQVQMMQVVVIKGKVYPGMNTGLCFQPLIVVPNFKKGIAMNPDGTLKRDKNDKAIMEKDLCKQERRTYRDMLKEEFPNDWKKAFYHSHFP